MKSIRRKVTWLIIALLVLITFSAALTGYRASMKDATRLFDGELTSIAKTLIHLPLSDQLLELESTEDVAWQLWENHRLAMRSTNAPNKLISTHGQGFVTENFLGNRWRVLVLTAPLSQRKVLVAHPIGSRNVLAENLITSAMTPLIIAIPFLTLLIFVVVSSGLKPLMALSRQLQLKQRNNLEPIRLKNTPTELATVIDTINLLFNRLSNAFEREELFSANAAHELRTPLSVLKINLHNLLETSERTDADIRQCQKDTDRMIHVVNQLLLLSRTNPETIQPQMERIDLEHLAQVVISECYERIDKKRQNIELNCQGATLQGSKFALQTLLTNLIENASKYSHIGGDIHVTIQQADTTVNLTVEDSGPGIPVEDYANVLTPFFRSANKNTRQQTGSGLGLAIVNQIVTLHHGKIVLSTSRSGGLAVNIQLPKLPSGSDI
jgi:two-component system sensor histidine kinase QseC